MSEQTLDRVARTLATGMPRRAVMKAAAAAAAGGLLTMVSRHEAAQARYQSPEKCCATQRHKWDVFCKKDGSAGLDYFECVPQVGEHSTCQVPRISCL
jgi:hypothetical protein